MFDHLSSVSEAVRVSRTTDFDNEINGLSSLAD